MEYIKIKNKWVRKKDLTKNELEKFNLVQKNEKKKELENPDIKKEVYPYFPKKEKKDKNKS